MSNNIQMDIVALATRVKDYTKRMLTTINVDASRWRRLLLILVIGYLGLAPYLRFASKNSTIPSQNISVIEKPRPPSIGGFYHFATVSNFWRCVVHEQMLGAHVSGLIAATSNIYVTGLGEIKENKTIADVFANPKFIYEYDTKKEVYEYPTLKKVEKFCLDHNESLVWYAHSKGASHGSDDSAAWRHVMNHFVLDKWKLCHELLSTTNYTTCGSIMTFDSVRKAGWNTYYAGNMWWAKCSHINRLTRIEKLDQNDRYIAELYVTSEPAVGHFNCYFQDLRVPIAFIKENASCTVNYPLWTVR